MHINHVLKQFVVFTYLLLIVVSIFVRSVEASEPKIGPTPAMERQSVQPPIPKSLTQETKYYPVKMDEVYISSEYSVFHPGLDFASNAKVAQPEIFAIEDGRVVYAEDTRYMTSPYGWGYGKLIVIEHDDGVFSLYAHLDDMEVKAGDTVQQGSKIGIMGSTGNSTGTHLHFEMFTKGEFDILVKLNPTEFKGIQKVLALLQNGQDH